MAAVTSRYARALADVVVARVRLRVMAPQSTLIEAGGCGTGRGFGKVVKVLEARRGAVVTFEDGRPAGKHLAPSTKVGLASDVGDHVCMSLSYVSAPICFERAKLEEVDER